MRQPALKNHKGLLCLRLRVHHRIMSRLHAIIHQLAPKPGEHPSLEAHEDHHDHYNDNSKNLDGFYDVVFFTDGLALVWHRVRLHREWREDKIGAGSADVWRLPECSNGYQWALKHCYRSAV
jgi:hypothetical protein